MDALERAPSHWGSQPAASEGRRASEVVTSRPRTRPAHNCHALDPGLIFSRDHLSSSHFISDCSTSVTVASRHPTQPVFTSTSAATAAAAAAAAAAASQPAVSSSQLLQLLSSIPPPPTHISPSTSPNLSNPSRRPAHQRPPASQPADLAQRAHSQRHMQPRPWPALPTPAAAAAAAVRHPRSIPAARHRRRNLVIVNVPSSGPLC
ncbi:hypothetical protein ACCO45_007255 [Purpureocillium lilacinum]|uniref:Uncharacterized protein n=1 Tax=Purpureocillium lilacinum TaxID=33203 RepID=A0ACC4DUW7_PURLI